MTDLLTIDDVARFCRVHKATIRRHIAAGRLRSVRVGRTVRVRREDLDTYLAPSAAEDSESAARTRAKPFTLDSPLWDIVGMIDDPDGVDWVSSNKRRALADAYYPRS